MSASLIGGPGLTVVLPAGGGLQALTWALARVRGAAARRGEWLPELAVRGAVLTLVVASLATPGPASPTLGRLADGCGLLKMNNLAGATGLEPDPSGCSNILMASDFRHRSLRMCCLVPAFDSPGVPSSPLESSAVVSR